MTVCRVFVCDYVRVGKGGNCLCVQLSMCLCLCGVMVRVHVHMRVCLCACHFSLHYLLNKSFCFCDYLLWCVFRVL